MNNVLNQPLVMGIGLISLLLSACSPAPQGNNACNRADGARHICNVSNVEDMLPIPNTPWVIGGNLGNQHWERGGFYLFNSLDYQATALSFEIPEAAERSPSAECPTPPDPELFSAHGMDMRAGSDGHHDLYVVNHGGRESVEIFDVIATNTSLAMRWKGCALIPNSYVANSVAALPGGGFAATVAATSANLWTLLDTLNGSVTGLTYEWAPTTGWHEIPGGKLPGNNGIRASKDGQWLFINGYNDGSLTKLSRDPLRPRKESVRLGFNTDNLSWTEDGKLLVTGHAGSLLTVVLYCNMTSVPVCPVDTVVAEVDPESLQHRELFELKYNEQFGGGTTTLRLNGEYWISSFRAPGIAILPEPNGD